MTLTELSRTSGVLVRSITAYENGHTEPSEESIQALATALRFPIDFFYGDEWEEVPVDAISFRALSKLTAREREAARSAARIAVGLDAWLSRKFTLPKANLATLPHLSPEEAAINLRGLWGLGEAPIPNMIHLLESKGIRVFSLAADCANVDAFCFQYEAQPYVFLNLGKSAERGRFDAAHELGHLIMHSEHEIPHGPSAERDAQQFASAFLMPKAGLMAQLLSNAKTDRILQAKRRWGVSAMALAYRLHDLGLSSEWVYSTTVKQLAQLGYRRGEPNGMERETSQLLKKVFDALRRNNVSPYELSRDIGITIDEMNSHLFGLVPVLVDGGGASTAIRRSLHAI